MMQPSLKAAIVAGGAGTRIRSLTGDLVPKALVPVAGEPIAMRQLDLLARSGIRRTAVLAGHLAEPLRRALMPKADAVGIELEFFVEDRPLGTAGGLPAAREFLAGDDLIVLYGDIAVDMDLGRLWSQHRSTEAITTIVAHPNDHPHESDLLRIDADGRVREILSRKGRPAGYYRNLVPAAVYCLGPAALEAIEPGRRQDFIGDVFPKMIAQGQPVFAYVTPEYLRDMGTPERYATVDADLASGLVRRMHFGQRRPAVFFDRDGVLNVEPGPPGVLCQDQLELLPGAAEAVRLVNRRGWLAVAVTNQPQLAKGLATFDELEAIHAKLETLLGLEGAYLDRIYFCPHHPERGFVGEVPELKVPCDCRKPGTGMIRRAIEELPIDAGRSCLIGDTHRDVGAARAAGLRAYGVRTGHGCGDCGAGLAPDRLCDDVLQAVRFALSDLRESEG